MCKYFVYTRVAGTDGKEKEKTEEIKNLAIVCDCPES